MFAPRRDRIVVILNSNTMVRVEGLKWKLESLESLHLYLLVLLA